MPRKELVGIWQPCSSPRPVRGLSHCTLTGQIHSLRSLTDSPELKQEHLKLYIKCQECQSSGTKSIFDNIWLAGRHWKCWLWQRWHSAAPCSPSHGVCPDVWERKGEQCPWGGMCLWIKEDPCSRAGPFPSHCQTHVICTCAPICLCNWYVHTGTLRILVHSGVGTAAPSAPQLSTPQGKVKGGS